MSDGSYQDYLQSEHWREKRTEALEAAGFKCESCGARSGLQVHHKHYDSLWNESLDDLEVLCRDCHSYEHRPGLRIG